MFAEQPVEADEIMLAVETKGIRKRFGNYEAVRGIDFQIPVGINFALLGPNGAGKSTLIRMLTALIEPTEGTAHVCGHDVRKDPAGVRHSIGVVPQNATSDPELTAYENIAFYAGLYGIPMWRRKKLIEPLLEAVDLVAWKDKKVGTFSGGMRRRLEVARSLIHHPKVLFLDEPTTGLDPASRIAMWEMIRKVKAQARLTMFLTTHYMEEADNLCELIAIVDHGKLVAMGAPSELKAQLPGMRTIEVTFGSQIQPWCEIVERLPGVSSIKMDGGVIRAETARLSETLEGLSQATKEHEAEISSLRVTGNTLEDVFVFYTGKDTRDSAGGSLKYDVSHLYNRGGSA